MQHGCRQVFPVPDRGESDARNVQGHEQEEDAGKGLVQLESARPPKCVTGSVQVVQSLRLLRQNVTLAAPERGLLQGNGSRPRDITNQAAPKTYTDHGAVWVSLTQAIGSLPDAWG
jgi:hypothetical protein